MNSRLLLWMLFVAAFVPPSVAVLMEPLSLEELTARSSLVLHGTVLSKSCQRDTQGRIYTKVELDVAEVWKGSLSAKRFTIVHGGGILGEKRVVVSGQVEYGIGEEVVAFLVLNQREEGVTLGLTQGKFRVWKDAKTGEVLAQNPFHGGQVPLAKTGEPAVPSRLPITPRSPAMGGPSAGLGAQGAVDVRGVLTLVELKRRVQEGNQTATSGKAGDRK